MIHEINHFGIDVSDMEKSLAFYRGILGGRVIFDKIIPSSQTNVIYLQIAGGIVELLYHPDPAEVDAFGVTHIGFISDDLDNDFTMLVEAGYEGLVSPRPAGSGVGRVAFVHDPNGARVELIERENLRVTPIEHPIIKSLDHYSLIANDEDAASTFYKNHLGLKELKTLNAPAPERTLGYLTYDYDVLELLHSPMPISGSLFAHIAFRVSNVDDALAVFAAQGVTAEPGTVGPSDTGLGRVAVIRDPDGVTIELLDRPDLREL